MPPGPPEPVNPYIKSYTPRELAHWKTLRVSEQLDIIETEGAAARQQGAVPMRFRILSKGFEPAVCRRLLAICEILSKTPMNENLKRREYMETVLSVPLKTYVSPFSDQPSAEVMARMNASLDRAVYGHSDTKRAIMRVVAQWLRHPEAKGMSILLCGPPGTAKSSIVHEGVSKALGMPYSFVGLGGANGASSLTGFEYCYTGSDVGEIARSLIRNGSMSQVYLMDEVDKVSDSERGEEIISTLVHLTDETSNARFRDKYLGDIDLDMSRSLFFFTCNDASRISPILLDRMVRIDVAPYSAADKAKIAERHLLPDAFKAFGLDGAPEAALISAPDYIRRAVALTCAEKGVRGLKRALRATCSEVNLRKMLDAKVKITASDLDDILRKETSPASDAPPNMMYN